MLVVLAAQRGFQVGRIQVKVHVGAEFRALIGGHDPAGDQATVLGVAHAHHLSAGGAFDGDAAFDQHVRFHRHRRSENLRGVEPHAHRRQPFLLLGARIVVFAGPDHFGVERAHHLDVAALRRVAGEARVLGQGAAAEHFQAGGVGRRLAVAVAGFAVVEEAVGVDVRGGQVVERLEHAVGDRRAAEMNLQVRAAPIRFRALKQGGLQAFAGLRADRLAGDAVRGPLAGGPVHRLQGVAVGAAVLPGPVGNESEGAGLDPQTTGHGRFALVFTLVAVRAGHRVAVAVHGHTLDAETAAVAGVAEPHGGRVDVLGQGDPDRPVGGQCRHGQVVVVGAPAPAAAVVAFGDMPAGLVHGAGETRVGSDQHRRHRVADQRRQLEGAARRLHRVGGVRQVGGAVANGQGVAVAGLQRLMRTHHHRGAVQGPVEGFVGALAGERQCLFQALRVERLAEVHHQGVAGLHRGGQAVLRHRHGGLQERGAGVRYRRRRVVLVRVGFSVQAEQAEGGLLAKHFRLHHAQGVDHQARAFHFGDAHQLHLQQGLAERAVGFRVFRRHRHVHEQSHLAGRLRALAERVGQQVAAGVGEEGHGDVAGFDPRRHRAGHLHCNVAAGEQAAARNAQWRHVRVVGQERQLGEYIAALLGGVAVAEQGRFNRYAVHRLTGEFGTAPIGIGARVLATAGRRRRLLDHHRARPGIPRHPAALQPAAGEGGALEAADRRSQGEGVALTGLKILPGIDGDGVAFGEQNRRHQLAAPDQRDGFPVGQGVRVQHLVEPQTQGGEVHERQGVAVRQHVAQPQHGVKAPLPIGAVRGQAGFKGERAVGEGQRAGVALQAIQRHSVFRARAQVAVRRAHQQAQPAVHRLRGGQGHAVAVGVAEPHAVGAAGERMGKAQHHRAARGHPALAVVGVAVENFRRGGTEVVGGPFFGTAAGGQPGQAERQQQGKRDESNRAHGRPSPWAGPLGRPARYCFTGPKWYVCTILHYRTNYWPVKFNPPCSISHSPSADAPQSAFRRSHTARATLGL